ncbi:DNA-directed RNA polymerase I and III 14 KDA polypeptide [Aspergillus fumigatus A1163]|uniref:DNA-directed RNA polymerase I and III 14 kDa polypeptide n=2 Tax=Aspergillus fumigatus TaxID=746128 RepID=Q4WDF9_ASPFU|nr:DNA-directed RNA polymerase I and III 14 KDA polypeptide [Aspergillus fumigatus Af293]EAL85579.1 DNA-directed RNA polymerase I and III 14 KDA polypeptide [Aspergillus fumigatus Af293]EDP47525.1 DNA-directed RNA polymerase I and III 14 KDA polypeptide [Aspergillus fumigatus A1163]KEY81740.1 DNA directed RNA polymerase I and III 14 KDA polypeptide [Aspergillus fumigatus]
MPASVHSQDQDQSMMDTAPQELEQQQDYEQEEFELEEKRIVVLPGATETAASFQFEGEGHTLGNALRYAIMKNPEVEFCGYTIPHPSEAKMNLRIQTYGMYFCHTLARFDGADRNIADSTTAVEALEKGLEALMDLCDVVTDKFTSARDAFNAAQADKMTS